MESALTRTSVWLHRYAVLTAGATLLLIMAGGLVTSTGSGLAVPDWPLAFGMVFPPMVGGVLFEHGHRMIATFVGMLTVVLAVWIWKSEGRRWLRYLGLAALAAVVVQGLLGGITVLYLLPTAVSVTHACLAQIFFCLTISIALFTSRGWQVPGSPVEDRGSVPLRGLTILASATVFLQLLLGAIMRHMGAGLAIPDFPLSFGHVFPPLDGLPLGPEEGALVTRSQVLVHFAHRSWSVIVLAVVVWVASQISRRHPGRRAVAGPARLLLGLVIVQVAVGAHVIWTGKAVAVTTVHVATGASILATSVVLCLQTWRLFVPPSLDGDGR